MVNLLNLFCRHHTYDDSWLNIAISGRVKFIHLHSSRASFSNLGNDDRRSYRVESLPQQAITLFKILNPWIDYFVCVHTVTYLLFMSCSFMSCNFMPCNFDGPTFSCPSFSVSDSDSERWVVIFIFAWNIISLVNAFLRFRLKQSRSSKNYDAFQRCLEMGNRETRLHPDFSLTLRRIENSVEATMFWHVI